MPRIAREEHPRIRERIEVGREKVAAVAASYGCSSANIYAILTKLRRAAGPAEPTAQVLTDAPLQQLAFPTEASAPAEGPARGEAEVPAPATAAELTPVPDPPSFPQPVKAPATAVAPARPPSAAGAPGHDRLPSPRGLKSGYALMMRTSDGEEAVNPFRSLEDLLSAAKPILRNAARSPEPVWFSIQPVDLAALEDAH
jgi:hypothetical protein